MGVFLLPMPKLVISLPGTFQLVFLFPLTNTGRRIVWRCANWRRSSVIATIRPSAEGTGMVQVKQGGNKRAEGKKGAERGLFRESGLGYLYKIIGRFALIP